MCLRECNRIFGSYKLHNSFGKSGDEKILEVLEMSVPDSIVVDTSTYGIRSVSNIGWNADDFPIGNDITKLAEVRV